MSEGLVRPCKDYIAMWVSKHTSLLNTTVKRYFPQLPNVKLFPASYSTTSLLLLSCSWTLSGSGHFENLQRFLLTSALPHCARPFKHIILLFNLLMKVIVSLINVDVKVSSSFDSTGFLRRPV